MFIRYCVFSLKCCDFLNTASSAATLVFYLPFSGPSMKCTHRGKTERGQSPEYILKFSKKTQYLMNTLYNHDNMVKKILIANSWTWFYPVLELVKIFQLKKIWILKINNICQVNQNYAFPLFLRIWKIGSSKFRKASR